MSIYFTLLKVCRLFDWLASTKICTPIFLQQFFFFSYLCSITLCFFGILILNFHVLFLVDFCFFLCIFILFDSVFYYSVHIHWHECLAFFLLVYFLAPHASAQSGTKAIKFQLNCLFVGLLVFLPQKERDKNQTKTKATHNNLWYKNCQDDAVFCFNSVVSKRDCL